MCVFGRGMILRGLMVVVLVVLFGNVAWYWGCECVGIDHHNSTGVTICFTVAGIRMSRKVASVVLVRDWCISVS